MAPDLDAMLARRDAALIIGDNALFLDRRTSQPAVATKIDLGEVWTRDRPACRSSTRSGPAGPDALTPDDVDALQRARDEGVAHADEVARGLLPDDAGAPGGRRALPAG